VVVDFIVDDKILSRVIKLKAVNNIIIYIELECRWFNVVLINGYAPTEDKENKVKNIRVFYKVMDNVCDLIPSNKLKILLRNFNAEIGQEIINRPTIEKENLRRVSNDNGTKLVNILL